MNELFELLTNKEIDFEIINHTIQINSAKEGADYFGIEIGQTAPTLILKTDRGYFSLIVSGDYGRVDLETIKEIIKAQEVRFAKPKEVEEATGSRIGCVSLINPTLPTIIDRGLYRYSYVFGGTGKSESTLKISPRILKH
ncbi:Cys-tRNA(Pro) deacylase, prolyl-tRNA editing enzyme YbaK/EbsC [Paenibacillus barengoltzii]|uniref:aminoacyl-tRNA deacylase n=1 Tax=Paenibacillus barengoltzii TaxID=343517 RepID=UPI000A08B88F|nr:YbaK/EbsC family protein [Paenibacillus barengoltzii]SMF68946.1 Cys-tRNA(Pro) deacylase, prolyl-tRNA editing enzyme YbaK/EbsC [Paenibacillus barengoltzii]